MQNRRLLFSFIIKSLVLSGLLLLAFVFIKSLFTGNGQSHITRNKEIPVTVLGIADMQKGQIRKARWNNKEVAVLLRQNAEKLIQSSAIDSNKTNFHSSINLQTRSIEVDYFVYVNIGDSSNCPLFYSAGEFKDICSSNKFDEAGRALESIQKGFQLKIPPHYFNDNSLFIGKWGP